MPTEQSQGSPTGQREHKRYQASDEANHPQASKKPCHNARKDCGQQGPRHPAKQETEESAKQ
jgi:hypothetical protein